jgi:transposase
MAQIHIMTGPERRRPWSDEQKRTIVAAAFAPGAVVADVARQADVHPSLIYRWRQELRALPGFAEGPGFAEVIVTPEPPDGTPARAEAVIEVDVAERARVRIPVSAPPDLAAAVIAALARR